MLKTSAIFKDGMVLQRNAVVKVFGRTDYDSVEVHFWGKTYKANIDGSEWIAEVETAEAGRNLEMTITGRNIQTDKSGSEEEQLIIRDILLGDVWLAGGQSNMELELRNSQNGESVAADADYNEIRFYNVPKIPFEGEELEEAENNTTWNPVKGDACRYMSAVAYYFATRIHKETGVPIGIIDCYWGGTSATCWVERESLKDVLEVQGYVGEWDEICNSKSDDDYDRELNEYNEKVNKWVEIEAQVKCDNPAAEFKDVVAAAGDYPWPPPKGNKAALRPFGLHKTMVSRISPYTIKGIIYYQAEEDAERAAYYSKLNSAVINQWRSDFSGADVNEAIPFYLTQLPMFISEGCEDDKVWCELRRQQEQCSIENENTHVATIIDCGEFNNIHPIDKKTPGNRLAEQALEYTYRHEAGAKNLKLLQSVFHNNVCEITFDNTFEGLCYKMSNGTRLTSQVEESIELGDGEVCTDKLYGFEVSQDGINFFRPEVVSYINRLELKSKTEEAITDVRYAWTNYGVANVYSGAGLPLMPFWIKNE